MDLYGEFFKIIREFNRKRVRYALIGGIAMGYYAEPRFTKDIDILTLPSELDKISGILCVLDFEESAQPWTFLNTKITLHRFAKVEKHRVVSLDVLIGGDSFHQRIVAGALRLKSGTGTVKIARKEDLIALKSIRNSDQDKVDIKMLGQP